MGPCSHQVNPLQAYGALQAPGQPLASEWGLGQVRGALLGGLRLWQLCGSCVRTPGGFLGVKPRAAACPGTRSTPGMPRGTFGAQVNPRQVNEALKPPGQPQASEWGLAGTKANPGKRMGPCSQQVNPR